MIGLRQMVRDLLSQKLRTFLTLFGIIWGTVAISLLLAFGEGLGRQVRANSAGLGENICIAWPSLTSIPYEGLGKGRRIRLTEEDMQLISLKATHLAGISGEYTASLKTTWGTKTLAVDVSGINPVFGDLRNIIPAAGGRFVNALDEALQRRVVFLGDALAVNLFGAGVDPIGRTLLMRGSPFTVVGVMKTKTQDSSYSGRDKDKAFVPGSTLRALTGEKFVDNFIFKARQSTQTEAAKTEVLEILARRHRFDPKDKEALGIWDTTEMFQFIDGFMLGFRLFLGIVGGFTLIVGGIGVSNIMNVVVEERTREIGIKMALGARTQWVLGQFMFETLAVTAFGGAIGLGISAAICKVVPLFGLTEFIGTPAISPFVGTMTAGLLGVIGFLAGWFPAREAAGLDPVVAMKL
ncbi:MAG TPA: ABC transporter permease [Candidatus Polarisedimenticolia bacterium]|nr:ABC transporter permease [Candidatus Polarisedimenticolia bacterium]